MERLMQEKEGSLSLYRSLSLYLYLSISISLSLQYTLQGFNPKRLIVQTLNRKFDP